MYYWS